MDPLDSENEAGSVAGDLPEGVRTTTTTMRRLCRFPGCIKVIKSQGHCQRHGAKAKRCRIDGCDKQAQGTHDGMCKRHWKACHFPEAANKAKDKTGAEKEQPPQPEGTSVYDSILPQSIAYKPTHAAATASRPKKDADDDDISIPDGVVLMPLVAYLASGADQEPGWHRNAERRARGLFPVTTTAAQLEPWERQLALVEIMLLSGGTPFVRFRDLAHAWGRDKGFHHVLANHVFERRGEVERKRRKDAKALLQEKEKKKKKLVGKPRAKPSNDAAAPAASADDSRAIAGV
jgi:hypothetical protein